MLTVGDIEFEPEHPKIVLLSSSLFALLAGDSALQSEILKGVYRVVSARITSEPQNWWKVRDVAELYADNYNRIRLCRAESEILQPLGLSLREFIETQRVMAPELVRDLSYQLQQFALPESVTAIICGVDLEGTHIMVVRGSHIEDRDAVGFAAIGIGDWHANSQFMFEKHTYFRSFTETLLLTYTAKRRAEVAPGVGLATDMFTVGPLLGNHVYPIGEHVLNKLAVIHSGVNAKIKESEQEAKRGLSDWIAEITKAVPAQQATPAPVSTVPPPAEQPPIGG